MRLICTVVKEWEVSFEDCAFRSKGRGFRRKKRTDGERRRPRRRVELTLLSFDATLQSSRQSR